MEKRVLQILGVGLGFIVVLLAAIPLYQYRLSSDANSKNSTRAEFSNINAELGKFMNELVPLKEKLAGHRADLTAAVKIIENNRGGKDETEVAIPSGAIVALLAVRRDTNMRLQEMEALQKEIVQKEAVISELKKRGGKILSGINGRRPDEKIPPDIELLRRAGHLLDSQAIAAPAAAK